MRTNLNLNLTPETLRELRALEAQRQSQAAQVWKGIGIVLIVVIGIGFVAEFWFVVLGALAVFGVFLLFFRRHVASKRILNESYRPPRWYIKLANWH